jgi:hypothetical protein
MWRPPPSYFPLPVYPRSGILRVAHLLNTTLYSDEYIPMVNTNTSPPSGRAIDFFYDVVQAMALGLRSRLTVRAAVQIAVWCSTLPGVCGPLPANVWTAACNVWATAC